MLPEPCRLETAATPTGRQHSNRWAVGPSRRPCSSLKSSCGLLTAVSADGPPQSLEAAATLGSPSQSAGTRLGQCPLCS